MEQITIPPDTGRDERDAIIRRATTQFTRVLRRVERLRDGDTSKQVTKAQAEDRSC